VGIGEGSVRWLLADVDDAAQIFWSMEAALWAFHDADNFRQAVLKAVNLGDDADTTGAVCGQLAGACWGEAGIPEEWLAELAGREMIEGALWRLLASRPSR